MKNWKKSLLVASLAIITALPVSAATLKTVGGTMNLPTGVSSYTLSESNFAKILYAEDAKTPINAKQTNPVMLKDILGKAGDFYQIQGRDSEGVKSAQIVAVDIKNLLKTSKDPRTQALLSTIDSGATIDPLTESMMISTVNSKLGSLESMINLSLASNNGNANNMFQGKVKLQDLEPVSILPGTNYKTYTTGGRALVDINGFQLPYYLKAALVLKPKTPTAYVMLTSDVERDYFKPVITNMLTSLK